MEEWGKKIKLLRVLNTDYETKLAAFEGEIEENDGGKKTTVLVFEKTPFQFDNVEKLLKDNEQQYQLGFINDVYHTYTAQTRSVCNGRPMNKKNSIRFLFLIRYQTFDDLSRNTIAYRQVFQEKVLFH